MERRQKKHKTDAFNIDLDDDKLAINFYLDKEYKFTQLFQPKTKIEDIKETILLKLSLYSINYKMEYNDHDIGGFDDFTIHQIFLNKKKEEYDIYLTLVSTLKKFEGQRVLMTYVEGTSEVILYKILSMKWLKITPYFSSRLQFSATKKFPYNSRGCHVMSRNQLVITGGIGAEKMACYFDADTENVVDLPDMQFPRERHSMVAVDASKVMIVGGAGSNKVTCLDVEFEAYEEFPSMKYTRKDCSLCFVNERYLYVFMGYCDELGKTAENFEKLDVKEDGCEWKIFPMNNYSFLTFPRSYCGVVFLRKDNCFYFFGGSHKSTVQSSVMRFDETKFNIEKTNINLPIKTNFGETCFVRPNMLVPDYYLFTFQSNDLIYFNEKNMTLKVVDQEWLE